MRVDFYHLTAMPLERALPQIAGRVVAGGGRLLVVEADEARRAGLDRMLWAHAPDSFLPHGVIGGAHDARQPVLIAGEMDAANGARNIALVDGVWRDDALDFERVFHFFADDSIVQARAAWRGLAARDGVERYYWKQNDAGRWEEAARG